MPELGFLAESVTAALTGLLVSDAYTSLRPRLGEILGRSRSSGGIQVEELDRLRGANPETLRSAVRDLVQRLEASDAPLLRQLFYALAVPAPDMRIHVHDNQFHGPTQMGGIQIVNMREAEHEPEL